MHLGSEYATYGWVSTVDLNGDPTCSSDHTGVTLSTPIVYMGRVSTAQNGDWLLPDLSDYGPGVPAFEECTLIGIGGSPIALTPAHEIKLPNSTLALRQASASATPTLASPSDTPTIRPPTTSNSVTLPLSTISRQQSDASTEREPAPSQDTTRPDPTVSTQSRVLPDSSRSPDLPNAPASQEEADETIGAIVVPTDSSSPSQPDAPRSSSVQPSQGVSAGNSDARPSVEYVQPSSASNPPPGGTPSTIDIVRVNPTETPDSSDVDVHQPEDPYASYIAIGISGGSLDVDGSDANNYVLPNGATVAASEQAVEVAGTTFSALPSGNGVVAIADGTSTTLTALPNADYTPPLRIPVTPNDDAQYAVQDGSTITAGGQAVSISGTTYSALPSNSGVVIVANGQSTTLAAASLPTPPPLNSPDTYILGGSVTVSVGGPAQTISGTTYSALPSNSGILVVAEGETTKLAGSSIPGSDATKVVNSYIIDGTATISAGGPVVAISGTTYSALPSGSGVVAVEGGESSTIGEDDNLVSNATGSAGQQDGVTPFEGGAVGSRARPGSTVPIAFLLLFAYVV
jgi:hypothetical protein